MTVIEKSPVPAAQAWTALAVLVLLSTLSYLDRQIIALLVQPIRADLGISDFQISLLQGIAFAFFYCVFALPIGVLVDRRSRRFLIYLGVSFWSIGAMGCGLASNYEQLLIARFMVGAGEAVLMPAGCSMLSDLFPRHRLSLALSIIAIGGTLGNALSYGIGGFIISTLEGQTSVLPIVGELAPWQMTFFVTGMPGLLMAFLIFLIPEPKRTGVVSTVTPPLFEVFRFMKRKRRFFVGHLLGFALMAMTSFGAAAWAAVVLTRNYQMDVASIGLLMMGGMGVGGLLGFLVCGSLIDRLFRNGRRDAHLVFFMWTMPIGAAIICAGAFAPTPILFVASLGLAQFITSFAGASAAALQIVTPNELRGQVSAIYLFVTGMIGMGFGPTAVALFTEHVFVDPAKANLSIAALYLVAAPATLLLLGMARKPMREAVDAVMRPAA